MIYFVYLYDLDNVSVDDLADISVDDPSVNDLEYVDDIFVDYLQ